MHDSMPALKAQLFHSRRLVVFHRLPSQSASKMHDVAQLQGVDNKSGPFLLGPPLTGMQLQVLCCNSHVSG